VGDGKSNSESTENQMLISLGVHVGETDDDFIKEEGSKESEGDSGHYSLEAQSPSSAVGYSVSEDEGSGGQEVEGDGRERLESDVAGGETLVRDGVGLPDGLDQRDGSVNDGREGILTLPSGFKECVKVAEGIRESGCGRDLLVVKEPHTVEYSEDGERDD